MKIIFACDHAGFGLKEYLKTFVSNLGYDVFDVGALEYVLDDDYPEYIARAAQMVSEDSEHTRAIILGGSGQGEAIVANRFPGVRAIVYLGEAKTIDEEHHDSVVLAREHNDANVLSLGSRFITPESAEQAVRRWLDTPFSDDERHARRVRLIETLTQIEQE